MITASRKKSGKAALSPGEQPCSSTGRSELAETRLALSEARKQIRAEAERRHEAEDALERHLVIERERVRKQLHDGLGQMLTSISFLTCTLRAKLRKCGLQETAELDEIFALVNQAISESKAIAAGCDPKPRANGQLMG